MQSIFLGGVNYASIEAPNSKFSFFSRLKDSGFCLTFNPHEADFAICVDNEKTFTKKIISAGIPKDKSILIRNEPVVVCPGNRSTLVMKHYGLVLNMGRSPKRFQNSLPWPQQWPATPANLEDKCWLSEKIVLVNGNKISFIGGELYSLRRKAIKFLGNLDLYGTAWDMTFKYKLKHAISNLLIAARSFYLPKPSGLSHYFRKVSNWKGSPVKKIEVLSKYKYCLVIENSCEFMTEKLFDAFFARCIPIYVGPDLRDFPIPSNLYIQAEPNLKSIQEKIIEAHDINYGIWSGALEKWINLEETKNYWSADSVNLKVIAEIRSYCDSIV